MSLTTLLTTPEVAKHLKPLRPKGRRAVEGELVAPAQTKRFSLVGVAFDYLLRFELQRRVPSAVVRPWAAKEGLTRIYRETGDGMAVSQSLVMTGGPQGNVEISRPDDLQKLHVQLSALVEKAKSGLAEYLQTGQPERDQMAEMARHALRLAHTDYVLRSRRLAADFEHVDMADVDDLLNMLDVVPFELFARADPLLLNPVFGEASRIVGGADADLIAGSVLYDVKTTAKAVVKTEYLDQLFGYYLLAERHRLEDRSFPRLATAGIYFSRHACIWTMETAVWSEHPQFAETAEWFFTFAGEPA